MFRMVPNFFKLTFDSYCMSSIQIHITINFTYIKIITNLNPYSLLDRL